MIRLGKDELYKAYWRYYEEYKKHPMQSDMDKAKGYPSITQYKREWGTWRKFLEETGIWGEDSWLVSDENILKEKYRHHTQEDIITSLSIIRSWSTIKQKAARMGLKRDTSAINKKYKDIELLISLSKLNERLGRTPKIEDLEREENMPTHKVYAERFGSWNNALIMINLKPNTNFSHSKEKIMKDVISFYQEKGVAPKYNELDYSSPVFSNYWRNWNEMLNECGIPVTTSRGMSEIEIEKNTKNSITLLNELANNLGRIPIAEEYFSFTKSREKRDYLSRGDINNRLNMTFSEFCSEYLSEDILNSDSNKVFYDNLGNRCFSISEQRISNIFISNNIIFNKETPYKNVINIDSEIRFDWELKLSSPVYVEYFGLYREDRLEQSMYASYYQSTKNKINLCKQNNILLIELYPNDIQNNFKGMIKKFKSHGIELDIVSNKTLKNAI